MGKSLTKFLIFAGLTVIAVGVFVLTRPDNKSHPATLPVLALDPTPSPSQVTTVLAPDGKKTLIMKEKKDGEGINHTFSISSDEDGLQKVIFTKTLPRESSLTIPYNAFSPDDKYIFLKEINSGEAGYFVLSTSGTLFAGEVQTLDISGSFKEKYADYVIADVTGWGGPNLVVVNTYKSSGGKGPSFWFDVGSKSFIRLSHAF